MSRCNVCSPTFLKLLSKLKKKDGRLCDLLPICKLYLITASLYSFCRWTSRSQSGCYYVKVQRLFWESLCQPLCTLWQKVLWWLQGGTLWYIETWNIQSQQSSQKRMASIRRLCSTSELVQLKLSFSDKIGIIPCLFDIASNRSGILRVISLWSPQNHSIINVKHVFY